MRLRTAALAACLAALAAPAAVWPAAAVEPGSEEVSAAEDLLAVLRLRGKRCAGIERHVRRAEADYEVTCSDGPRYRIRVDADERVVIEELEPASGS